MAKIRPRARIIRTIGDKLISGPEAALIELVKNSYDADASWVRIKITSPVHSNGRVNIEDNGVGMSYDNIINNWLEPATDSKKINKKSSSNKRVVLGAKGVGRFAASSLGRYLSLKSKSNVNGALECSELKIDWDIFEEHKYLDDIDIEINKVNCITGSHTGVAIEISDVKTVWDKEKIKKLVKELRRLAVRNNNDSKFDIYLELDGFSTESAYPYNFEPEILLKEANSNIANDSLDRNINLILPYAINEQSDYLLEGRFDEDGGFNGEFTIIRGDNTPISISIEPLSYGPTEVSCGVANIKLKLYDLESESIEKLCSRMNINFKLLGLRAARSIITENTGVAIYRAGFRIRPYGDPDNDWLHLEKRRVQNPSRRIGHTQIAGEIHVDDESESSLIERSSREGLEFNGAFERLTRLVTNLLINIEAKRFSFREKAGISRKPQKGIEKAKNIASLESISQAVQVLNEIDRAPLLRKIEKESKALTQALEDIEEYQKLLESRAALGMVVAQVLHDGRTYLLPINDAAINLSKNEPFFLEDSKKGELVRKYLKDYCREIKEGANGLNSLFRSLDPISGKKGIRPSNYNIFDVIEVSRALLNDKMIENGVDFFNETPKDVFSFGHKGDLQAALLNIFNNAVHWLGVSSSKIRHLKVHLSSTGNKFQIYITNNGPRIDESDEDLIFDAGFSLKTEGHGLGLIIAREACRHSGGDLLYVRDHADTCFLIEIPVSEVKNEG